MDIIFMGTPGFAVPALKKLNEKHNIVLVVTQPDRVNSRGNKVTYNPVKQTALDLGLEIFQPESINTDDSVEYLKQFSCDMIVVVAYGQIIRKNVRDIPKINIVNIHASLLPKYRGAAPINWAIIDREEKTGISIMQVSEGLDTGEVYLTRETEIGSKTVGELFDELSILGAEGIDAYMELDLESQLNGTQQDDQLSSHSPKIYKELGHLKFDEYDVNKIVGLVKGLSPKPGAYVNYNEQTMKIINGEVDNSLNYNGELGQIVNVSNTDFTIKCKDGNLVVNTIQMPNKKIMSVEDYLRGNSIEIDVLLI